MWNYSTLEKNSIDVTNKIGEDDLDGAFINPDTGNLKIYNEGGFNETNCNIHKLFEVIKNNSKLSHLLKEFPENNKCSNCQFWTKEIDPCEWWTGKFIDDWKDAKFCSKSDFFEQIDNNETAGAISKEGYIAGLMTKPDHSCSMFQSKEFEQNCLEKASGDST